MSEKYPEYADPQLRPRYLGLPTFMRAPYAEDLANVDIAMVGVPFDGGVTNRPGARHGPREVRNQSSLIRTFNPATGVNPFELCRVADVGDAWAEEPYELTQAHHQIQEWYERLNATGARPLSVGGDHSITLPILRALAADGPVGMIHIDAHADTGGDYMGSKFHHGSPFRNAVLEGLLDPKRVCQIGIRGSMNDPALWDFSYESGMRVIRMEEFTDMGWAAAIADAREVVGDMPTYVSFDIDALDPVYAPGTGTPEAGGITMIEAQRMIRELSGLNIVGADVVEVSPPFDVSGLTAMHGATVMYEILCVMAEAVAEAK
ncbi:agmatinase [Chachezhania antarctica]|uniref:agmatinase n=1 Tax=Chachezhania antarctica TaxID=2340860 RepID=UPI000EAF998E|nr:agmatinase [Chachezhania antarctica]